MFSGSVPGQTIQMAWTSVSTAIHVDVKGLRGKDATYDLENDAISCSYICSKYSAKMSNVRVNFKGNLYCRSNKVYYKKHGSINDLAKPCMFSLQLFTYIRGFW